MKIRRLLLGLMAFQFTSYSYTLHKKMLMHGMFSFKSKILKMFFFSDELPKRRIVDLSHFLKLILTDTHNNSACQCSFTNMTFVKERFRRSHSHMTSDLEFKCEMCGIERVYPLLPLEDNIEADIVNGMICGGK